MWRIFLTCLITASAAAAEPSTMPTTRATTRPAGPYEQLAAQIPAMLSDDPTIKSFDLRGELSLSEVPIEFRLRQTASGHTAVYVEFAARHVPIFLIVDGEGVFYDSANGIARRFHDIAWTTEFSAQQDQLHIGSDFKYRKKDQPRLVAKIDFRSILLANSVKVEAEGDGPLEVITSTSAKGNPTRFWFDSKKQMPLVALAVEIGKRPIIAFHHISINESVDEVGMRFPTEKELAALLPIRGDEGFLDRAAYLAGAALSVGFEVALDHPEMRASIEKKIGKVNWEQRRKLDDDMSVRLKKLFDLQFPATQPAAAPATQSVQ